MIRRIAAIGLVIALMPLGCMLDESTHVIFVESDGSVTWRVVEDLIRSDRDEVRARLAEEDNFLAKAETSDDGQISTFEDLGAEHVDSWFVRHSRPYTRIVEARFDGLDTATQAMIDTGEVDAEVELVREDGLMHYTLSIPTPVWEAEVEPEDEQEAWIWASRHVRLALAEGRFVDERGFDLSDDGAIAVPRPLTEDEIAEYDGVLVYELVWDPRA